MGPGADLGGCEGCSDGIWRVYGGVTFTSGEDLYITEDVLQGSVVVARYSIGAGWRAGAGGCTQTQGLKRGDGS